MVKNYHKKPVVIEALQYTNTIEFYQALGKWKGASESIIVDDGLFVLTLEGTMKPRLGDYIIKGVRGEFYFCKEDIFLEVYELEDDLPN